ncbi:putative aspartic-type endopeptidase opsB [Talaromyces islandicus]|uniref:Putative aspartic-type endopeptidase opsB n=1 Tax=Talaromyces islandicus TaxID=28573 RepID=A0A0U1M4P5_TALIS|nr:putative aspartic-type endopeptidase opsB [Talaromyces islandicus]
MAVLSSLRGLVLMGLAATTALAEPRVLHMPITRNANHPGPLAKRASPSNTAQVTVVNDISYGLYYVNATVGTPGQELSLVLDTGSSDVWFFGPGAYDPKKSSSYKLLNKGDFEIQYGTEGSDVQGDYISDTISFGGATVKQATMAVAYQVAQVPTGIMGIGFDTNEAIVAEGGQPYKSIIDRMVAEGVISTKAYSLWLNDLFSSDGNCLFGGYDTKKFSGNLLSVPIQPDAQSGQLTSMTVAWTSLSLNTGSSTKSITPSNFAEPALLDSGTTLSIIPEQLYDELHSFFEAQDDESGNAIVDCGTLDKADGTLDFQFGGSKGPVIKVPFSEFALPATTTIGTWAQFDDGSYMCVLGMQPQTESDPIILGDTFLRSAYVVYDLDNKQISLAQTIFNATDSNVVEISKTSPVASVVTGVVVTQTASAGSGGVVPGEGGSGATTGGSSFPTETAVASATNSLGDISDVPTSTATSSSGGGSGAGATVHVPGLLLSLQAAGLSTLIGGALVALL